MAGVLQLLQQLRMQRRLTVQALGSLSEDQLTVRVGLDRPADVRSALLGLAQEDDRRCAALGPIFAALLWQRTESQRIFAGLGLARGHVRAALIGLTDDQLDQPPAPAEWGVRQALQHVMNNERRFVRDARDALERLHRGQPFLLPGPEDRPAPGALGPAVPGGLEDVLLALEDVRDQVVAGVAGLTAEELAAPMFGAGLSVDIRFMLHRRATHERQHTVQIYKTLHAIGCHQSEAQMLLGETEIPRGLLEGMVLGLPDQLVSRNPGNGLPSVEQLLSEARAEEERTVAAILSAMS